MPRWMSLSNVNMPCIVLFRCCIIVLVYNGPPSSTLHTSDTSFVPPPTHAVTSPSITSMSRDATSLIITQCLGLPTLYPHPTIPLSAHYAQNLFYHAQKSAPFILCPQRTRWPVLIAYPHNNNNICHLADAFIQSDLHSCVHTFYVWVVPGIEPTTLALQAPCSTNWATEG